MQQRSAIAISGIDRSRRILLIICALLASGVVPIPGTAQAANCAGYDSQIWAQSVYDADPTTYAALDPDGNGMACEDLPLGAAPALWTGTIPVGAEPVQLASITDGDTIRVWVNGRNEPVRLILIDTPETRHPSAPVECYGQEASAFLSWLLSLGGQLYLERDVSERDRYDRLLRYAWLDFGDGEVYLVNEAMARAGFASQSTYPPDVKYEAQIREAVAFAREHGYGLWSACGPDLSGYTNKLDGARNIVVPPGITSLLLEQSRVVATRITLVA